MAVSSRPKPSLSAARSVTPEALNVAPELLGRRLATPARRLSAMAIDLLLIGVVSSVANSWLVAALALAAWWIWRQRRQPATPRPRWIAPMIGALLVVAAVDGWRARTAPLTRVERDPAVAARVVTAAASGLQSASPTAGDDALQEAATQAALEAMAQRVESLEAEVKRLRASPPDWREKTAAWLDELGLGYGGALLYFTLVPLWWPGQTAGKRLLGIRVVELTGAPVTAALTFKRFGGYVAGLAIGGVGLAQVIWDHNRQGLHDRAARTLVLDERAGIAAAG